MSNYSEIYLEKFSKNNVALIDFIIKYQSCSNCGGEYDVNGKCIFCGNENKDYKTLIRELSNRMKQINSLLEKGKIDKEDIYKNFAFYAFVQIKDFEVESLQEFLKKTSLVDKIREVRESIKNDPNLTIKQVEQIEALVKYHALEDNEQIFYNFIVISSLKRSAYFTNDVVEKAICGITNSLIKMCNDNVRTCKIVDELDQKDSTQKDKSTRGLVTAQHVYLRRELVKNLAVNGSYGVIITIYHELAHVQQDARDKKMKLLATKENITPTDIILLAGNDTLMMLKQAKEDVIIEAFPKYYDDNYRKVNIEVEARARSRVYTNRFFAINGLQQVKYSREMLNKELRLHYDELRSLDGQEKNIDEIFEECCLNGNEVLKEYPVLNLEYRLNNGILTRKTVGELENDAREITTSKHFSSQIHEEGKCVYDELIAKSRSIMEDIARE